MFIYLYNYKKYKEFVLDRPWMSCAIRKGLVSAGRSSKMSPFTAIKSQLPGFKTNPEKKGDILIATSNYQRAVGGCSSTVNRHLNQLYTSLEQKKHSLKSRYNRTEQWRP